MNTAMLIVSGACLLVSVPAAAHHSVAMFDMEKRLVITGTVKQFQFANPHCFIQLLVPGKDGPIEWSIEMGAPAHLLRSGWTPATLTRGEKLTVVLFPLRDGGNGGNFVSASGEDGHPIGRVQ
jgi:Family of unknown function (DUF6152)